MHCVKYRRDSGKDSGEICSSLGKDGRIVSIPKNSENDAAGGEKNLVITKINPDI